MTKYQVLQPVANLDGFYEDKGVVFYDEGKGYSKTPEYVKTQLVKTGKFKDDIVVVNAGKF
jgi:hypothetical protein